MKPLALVIDDDPDIRDVLKDRLDSLGHDCHLVGSQSEAGQHIKQHTYAYVLLDLELPVRFGRPSTIATGKNILRQIREDSRNSATPVLVITGHGKDSNHLAVELMKSGACDYINKPFEDLEGSILQALQKHATAPKHNRTANGADSMKPFDGGEITITIEGIEIEGHLIAKSSSLAYRIVKLLAGKGKPMSGKALADALQQKTEAAINSAIKEVRKRLIQKLAAQNIRAESDSFIARGPRGYALAPGITVAVSAMPDAIDLPPLEPTPGERQSWVLEELNRGRTLRRTDLEKHFQISEATAKRDLAALSGKVDFVGGPKGHYVPSRRERSHADA